MREKIIDFLLNNADPSIVLRVKRELLNQLPVHEEEELLQKIIPQNNVQTVIQSQKPDGWFGNGFHGQSPTQGVGMFDNMEVGLRYLAEKGFPPECEYISKAVNAFLLDEPHFRECRLEGHDGLYLIRSSLILRVGYENILPKNGFIDLKHDINLSFAAFTNVLNYMSADDAVDMSKRKPFFKPGVAWPCSYDLRMLAHSQGWRSDKNKSLLADSMNRLFSFHHDHSKMVYEYNKGKYKSPCLSFIHNQMHCLGLMDENYINFDLMELFARCGVIKQVRFLCNKYEHILSLVDNSLNVNYKLTSRERGWGPYGGFALEEDWKSKVKKQCDMLFRVLLITHYAG